MPHRGVCLTIIDHAYVVLESALLKHIATKHILSFIQMLTLKKSLVEPEFSVPYLISVCFARSSAPSMGDSILSTVKKAAKLAVYEDIMMSVKNHHIQLTILVDIACGAISQPSGKSKCQKASTSSTPINCATMWPIVLYVLQLSRQYDRHIFML